MPVRALRLPSHFMNKWPKRIITSILAGIFLLLFFLSNASANIPFIASNNKPMVLARPFSPTAISGLVASYPFNGNANDESGNGNHGIVFGATLEPDRFCEANKAYYFNGSSYIATSTHYSAPGPEIFTFSLWFKTTSVKGGKLIGYGSAQTGASSYFDRNIYMTDDGRLYFGVYIGHIDGVNKFGVVKTTDSFNNGEWHHVAATLSADGVKLYVNGVLKGHDPSATSGDDLSGYWKIGYDELLYWPEQPVSSFFTGTLDDIYIYDRELSSMEIDQLYAESERKREETLCAGQSFNMFATTIAGASYSWTGPNEFTSSEQNPLIENVSTTQAGTYTVTITGSEGCAFQENILLMVDPVAVGGTLAGDATVCSGANSGTISLSDQTGNVLRWESAAASDFSSLTSILSTDLQLSYTNSSQSTYYRAVVGNGICEESYSSVALVEVREVLGGTISGPELICAESNSGILSLIEYQGDIIRWESSVDGFSEDVQSIANTSAELAFSNLNTTTSYRAVIGNGGVCPEVFSEPALVQVDEQVRGGNLSGGGSILCADDNSGSLLLSEYVGEVLRWESSVDNFADDIQAISHSEAVFSFQDLSQTTSYRAVLGSQACAEVVSEEVKVVVEQAPVGGYVQGSGRLKAGKNKGTLRLQDFSGNIIRWEVSADNFASDIRKLPYTADAYTYEDIEQDSWFRVVLQNNACPEVYAAPASLLLNKAPVAEEEVIRIPYGQDFSSEFSLLINGSDADGDPLMIPPVQDMLTSAGNLFDIDSDGYLHFKPAAGFVGTDSLYYQLCDDVGEISVCSQVFILVEVERSSEREVVVYQGFSPNNDGKNDSWVIDHIEQFSDNHVRIFNRYGSLVYEVKGYNNVDRVFEGISNKGLGSAGNQLPEGTYYYRIRLDEDRPLLNGYVILNR